MDRCQLEVCIHIQPTLLRLGGGQGYTVYLPVSPQVCMCVCVDVCLLVWAGCGCYITHPRPQTPILGRWCRWRYEAVQSNVGASSNGTNQNLDVRVINKALKDNAELPPVTFPPHKFWILIFFWVFGWWGATENGNVLQHKRNNPWFGCWSWRVFHVCVGFPLISPTVYCLCVWLIWWME